MIFSCVVRNLAVVGLSGKKIKNSTNMQNVMRQVMTMSHCHCWRLEEEETCAIPKERKPETIVPMPLHWIVLEVSVNF